VEYLTSLWLFRRATRINFQNYWFGLLSIWVWDCRSGIRISCVRSR